VFQWFGTPDRAQADDERRALGGQLCDDLNAQRLVVLDLEFESVFEEAMEPSRRHSARFFTRSLDLLHTAGGRDDDGTLSERQDDYL
jgi:hypothetical protein